MPGLNAFGVENTTEIPQAPVATTPHRKVKKLLGRDPRKARDTYPEASGGRPCHIRENRDEIEHIGAVLVIINTLSLYHIHKCLEILALKRNHKRPRGPAFQIVHP